jgi:hypothetical protein
LDYKRKGYNLGKTVLDLSSSGRGFCSSKNEHKKGQLQDQNFDLCENIVGITTTIPAKYPSWVRVPVNIFSLAWEVTTIEEMLEDQRCLFR